MKGCKRLKYTFSSIAEKNHIFPSPVISIFNQFIDMEPSHLPKVLSIDEFHLDKSWKNKFACIFIDWETSQIINIYPSKKIHSLFLYTIYQQKRFQKRQLPPPTANALEVGASCPAALVKYVSIDMNTAYKEFAYHHFKNVTVIVNHLCYKKY